ncbi:MAG: alcohol dehydrogenase catalytic domain-containing protein, partial [Planctomycetota bacterium]|nr:alcohol dehydrogenase catalytic domain-containing protein [Planctomycetota bacterium]
MEILAGVSRDGDARIRIRKVDLAEPGPDEALVKIVACGVCHTDVWMMASGG